MEEVMMHWWWDYYGTSVPWYASVLGPLMMVTFAVLIVLAIRYLWRNLDSGGEKKPLDILNERFARGEIDREEYENRRQALSSS
jgi:putative membrane protein